MLASIRPGGRVSNIMATETERELRKLLEKIEIKYFHKNVTDKQNEKTLGSSPILFKLTASQK